LFFPVEVVKALGVPLLSTCFHIGFACCVQQINTCMLLTFL
jgi:hypothetical protein